MEALIQLTLSNLDRKKQDQKVQGSHSQRKHRMAFTVLLRQYRLTGFSCSALFARRPRRSVCLHLDSVKSLRVKHTTICSKSTYTYSVRPNIDGQSHIAGYFAPNLSAEGAFGTSTRWTSSISLGSGNNAVVINFDASLSNPIFGASDTVQTSSMRGLCLIRAYQS